MNTGTYFFEKQLDPLSPHQLKNKQRKNVVRPGAKRFGSARLKCFIKKKLCLSCLIRTDKQTTLYYTAVFFYFLWVLNCLSSTTVLKTNIRVTSILEHFVEVDMK